MWRPGLEDCNPGTPPSPYPRNGWVSVLLIALRGRLSYLALSPDSPRCLFRSGDWGRGYSYPKRKNKSGENWSSSYNIHHLTVGAKPICAWLKAAVWYSWGKCTVVNTVGLCASKYGHLINTIILFFTQRRLVMIFVDCAFYYRMSHTINVLFLLTQRVDLGCVGVHYSRW